jgi:hypothetical protein
MYASAITLLGRQNPLVIELDHPPFEVSRSAHFKRECLSTDDVCRVRSPRRLQGGAYHYRPMGFNGHVPVPGKVDETFGRSWPGSRHFGN